MESRRKTLFGFGATDALGQSLDLIVPPSLQERHWSGFGRAMRTPKVKDMAADIPVRCADGQVRVFAGRLLVISDALGAMGIFATEGSTGIRPFG